MNNLLIWGTGDRAKQFVKNGYQGTIIGYIQTQVEYELFEGIPVYSPGNLPANYDYIIVANCHSAQVESTCVENNIDLDRVIFLYPFVTTKGIKDTKLISNILQDKNYTCYCSEFGIIENSFFCKDIEEYKKRNLRDNFSIHEEELFPIIGDKYAYAGETHNYFWQDLWAAKKVIANNPKHHFDIGSRLDGFIAHLLSAGVEVSMIDIREFPTKVDGLNTIVDDATLLNQLEDDSVDSLSAMCSLEHFGLGRYGDPVDPEACFKCFSNIQKKLKKGANLYLSLPIGRERVEFNAHRIFYPETVIECFSQMTLNEFSCTADGKLEINVDIHKYDDDKHYGDYRYGLFHFVKE